MRICTKMKAEEFGWTNFTEIRLFPIKTGRLEVVGEIDIIMVKASEGQVGWDPAVMRCGRQVLLIWNGSPPR